MRPIVLLASSRQHGNTRAVAELAFSPEAADYVDLSELRIGYYSHEDANANDDFLPLIQRLEHIPLWVLATPLYWYTMSAQAKTFLDRLSGLLGKDLGRNLRGKNFAVVCTGADPGVPASFNEPFRLTCEYLGMTFRGSHYTQFEGRAMVSKNAEASAIEFGQSLLAK